MDIGAVCIKLVVGFFAGMLFSLICVAICAIAGAPEAVLSPVGQIAFLLGFIYPFVVKEPFQGL
jgi:hypothetical protein